MQAWLNMNLVFLENCCHWTNKYLSYISSKWGSDIAESTVIVA